MSSDPSTATPAEDAAFVPRRLTHVSKEQVLRHYGGSTSRAARAMFITPSAVSMWPDQGALPATMRDRFQAALWREARMQDALQRAMAHEEFAAVAAA